jgi:SAM-dependent methyltransferase
LSHSVHTDSRHPDPSWFDGFFTELPNEFWRRAVPAEMTAAEIDFVARHLGLAPGARVLDVPCGSGRHTLALAARGYRVTGVDLSTEAIAYARRAAADAGLPATFVQADMRDVPHDAAFDAAVCLGNSFGYLDLPGTRTFVAALAAAVRPGGGLVVDLPTAAEAILPGYRDDPREMRVGDITVEATTEYDVARSRQLSHYRFVRGAEVVAATAVHHVRTVEQVTDLLDAAGFGDVALFDGPGGEPYALGASRLLLTARRTG